MAKKLKKKDDPKRFRTKKEFESYARRNGATIKEGSRHTKVKHKGKTMTLSRGGKKGRKPNPGLLKAYIKDFKRLGLITSLFFIGYLYVSYYC